MREPRAGQMRAAVFGFAPGIRLTEFVPDVD